MNLSLGRVPKLNDLLYELKRVDWYELGVQLDVPTHTLKNIGKRCPTETRKLSEVLRYWLNNGVASWEDMIKALEKIGGHEYIIYTIESEYIPQSGIVLNESSEVMYANK